MDTPNYKEATVSGTSWTRAERVEINNPQRPEASSLIFQEVEVTIIGDQIFQRRTDNLEVVMDPTDPLHLEIYDCLNRLYEKRREERDYQKALALALALALAQAEPVI